MGKEREAGRVGGRDRDGGREGRRGKERERETHTHTRARARGRAHKTHFLLWSPNERGEQFRRFNH